MSPLKILQKYFDGNLIGFETVSEHSRIVADKALSIARSQRHLALDLPFIEEAALLHDIGVSRIHAPDMHCFGKAPYICHGILGREILEREGMPRHALVCERHIGVGLTALEIVAQKLPLPQREMSPISDEERIVTLADLFFSKKQGELDREKSVHEVRRSLARFGEEKVAIFDSWLGHFGILPT
ncbi:HDIG domain-containing protein [Geomonas sp. RF6]|uniref:HD domain-containing protein n=1 Tax=Geomonas sp. RF6 TaxID=2897342 RepID=UPI001E5A3970|nr:HD domain-containing protein [Geomonas sp. RF6]UFS69881.1 HDIG domain-containing protein [Geomonas sp. RF6]